MNLPADLIERISTPIPHAPRTEWESVLDAFSARINTPASVKKYGVLTHGRIGKALKGKTAMELDRLFKDCAKARSFAPYFRKLTGV